MNEPKSNFWQAQFTHELIALQEINSPKYYFLFQAIFQ